jgi:zinc/manganese transport system permease protein
VTVWAAIAISFVTDWPIGFFVGAFSAVWYAIGRSYAAWRRRRSAGRSDTAVSVPLTEPAGALL